MPLEELDLPAWVACAEPNKKLFREAVHTILTAISSSAALRSTMVMKGGMLMAIRYKSSRFTKDADFSTEDKYIEGDEKALVEELSRLLQLIIASCKERGIDANLKSLPNPEVKKMAEEGYENLEAEIEGQLPPFQNAYMTVQHFYENLPWNE